MPFTKNRLFDLVHASKIDTEVIENGFQHIRRRETWVREGELGRGAYGTVYLERCEDGHSRRLRAVKELKKFVISGQDLDYMMELEAIVKFSHAKYSHRFVRSDGWFEVGDSIFIAMEYLKLRDLHANLNRPLPEHEAQQITKQLLEGLGFMHDNGFVHRDLKPGNIMVVTIGPDWFVKIGDFGISKRRQEDVTSFQTVHHRGTLGYTAPEALGFGAKDKTSYTYAVDIWSLGAVVHKLLTNNLVFPHMFDMLDYARGSRPFPVNVLLENQVSVKATAFVRQLMNPNPVDRPTVTLAIGDPWMNVSLPVPGKPSVAAPKQCSVSPAEDTWTTEASKAWTSESEITFLAPKEHTHSPTSAYKVRSVNHPSILPVDNCNVSQDAYDKDVPNPSNPKVSLWLDAQTGNLTKDKLEDFFKANPSISIDSEDGSGLTPLAYAIQAGKARTVELLLDNGASPDKKIGFTGGPYDGKTPMYLAATAKGQRARIVELLLQKNPVSFDEAISTQNDGTSLTPLMAAVFLTKDHQVAKLLIQSGASLKIKESKGHTPSYLSDRFLAAGLDINDMLETIPTKARGDSARKSPVSSYFGIRDLLRARFHAAVPFYKIASPVIHEPTRVADFRRNLDCVVKHGGFERGFPPGDPYVQRVAERAANLQDDPTNLLNTPHQINLLATLALYQLVIYCDDSESMNQDDRWDKQRELVKRIANIANRANPHTKGVHLRVINRDLSSVDNLDGVTAIQKLHFKPTGGTPIGTQLNKRVIEPLVYSVINADQSLEHPYLVMIITDGCPWLESEDQFRSTILECIKTLTNKGYRKDAVRFCISQIGTNEDAKYFLESLYMDDQVLEVLHVTPEILDVRYDELKGNEKDLEAWLLEVLTSPLKSSGSL